MPNPYARPAPLPKLSLYAHDDVIRAVRLLAVEDGVMVQNILRDALREYLARRGHRFTDIAAGT